MKLERGDVDTLIEFIELSLSVYDYDSSDEVEVANKAVTILSKLKTTEGTEEGKVYSTRNDYSHFGLTQEDQDEYGEVTDSKQALMDGYSFGDRQLEGVMFIVTVEEDGRLSVQTSPEYADYMSSLNEEMWLEEALDYAERNDMFEGLDGTEDIGLIMTNGDYNPGPQQPTRNQAQPITIQKTNLNDILGN
jgi:hypothetical protein